MTRDQILRCNVLARDGWVCQDCSSTATDSHHIIPKSHFGRNMKYLCERMENCISLCRVCHELKDQGAGAHTKAARKAHLELLQEKHGYEYTEPRFVEALNS